MTQRVRVQVRFTLETEYGLYSDSLDYSQDEFASKKQVDIDSDVQTRTDAWVQAIKNAPEKPEPTPEELQADIDSLDADYEATRADLETQLSTLQATLSGKISGK